MRIAVVNFSGNVGKSTLSRQLLEPRIPGCKRFTVETINSDEKKDDDIEPISAQEFSELNEYLLSLPSYIVDIGSSNIEGVMEIMKQYRGSHNDFDYFVVPVLMEEKIQRDCISTINDLLKMGVPGSKIKVILNRFDLKKRLKVENVFAPIFAFQSDLKEPKKFWANKNAVVYESDAFARAKALGKSIAELANDPTDYRAMLASISLEEVQKREEVTKVLMAQRIAMSTQDNLDDVFKLAFKK